ncbi:MAG: N-acetylmuramoyl-L-alanine amidase, partial [bacterium]
MSVTSQSPLPLSQVRWLVVHCSDSPYGDAQIIDRWHRQRGFTGIGYHFVILNPYPDESSWKLHRPRFESDGVVEKGRALELSGAHLQGRNLYSIGICLIGKDLFTSAQFFSLSRLLAQLKEK